MKTNIGLFFGGQSVEHEISIISALQAYEAIDLAKYQVTPIYVAKDGSLYTGNDLLDIANFKDIPALLRRSQKVSLARDGEGLRPYQLGAGLFARRRYDKIHVAFPVVHGTNVEDGTLQGYLAFLGVPYVGPDVLASAVGMDKVITKVLLRAAGVSVVDWLSFRPSEWFGCEATVVEQVFSTLGRDVIVKPNNLGSSIGITKASDTAGLTEAIETALAYCDRVIVERAVTNLREINCAVLGDADEVTVSECEEPLTASDGILSFADKYMKGKNTQGMKGTARVLPADLPRELRETISSSAAEAFSILRCAGVARVDFLVDMDDGRAYVNELNTIPGSLSFYLWEASGMTYTELIDRLIELALKQQRDRSRLVRTYDTNVLAMRGSKAGKSA